MQKEKINTSRPLLIMLYGYPGAGKTHFARQLSETLGAAHLHGDRLREELFDSPRYDKDKNEVIDRLVQYMAEEFLSSGVNVIYDHDAARFIQRRALRELARKIKANPVLIWLQIDEDSARARLKSQLKNSKATGSLKSFDDHAQKMQNPANEDFVVVSGKHTFSTQRSTVIKKLYELGLVNMDAATAGLAKPGLVNLIPNPRDGRVDLSRRNIIIR